VAGLRGVALALDDVLEHFGELLFVEPDWPRLLAALARFAGLTALLRLPCPRWPCWPRCPLL